MEPVLEEMSSEETAAMYSKHFSMIKKIIDPILQNPEYKIEKNGPRSTDLRNKGNDLFRSKYHDEKVHTEILKYYSECIAHAPIGSEELALGYANRSVLLLHIKKYESCIADIDRALGITQESRSKVKLLARKVECILLGQLYLFNDCKDVNIGKLLNEAEKLLNEMIEVDVEVESNLEDIVSHTKDLVERLYDEEAPLKQKPTISRKAHFPEFSKTGEIPCASDALAIEYNEKYGSHLVATRAVRVGEILMIEDGHKSPNPFNRYLICSHCIEGTYDCIPCDSCVFAVYCSEECKQQAWLTYHDGECTKYDYYKIMKLFSRVPHLYISDQVFKNLMHLRRMVVMGAKEACDTSGVEYLLSKFRKSAENRDKRTKGFMTTDGKLDGNRFESWISLSSNEVEGKIKGYFMPFSYMLMVDTIPSKTPQEHFGTLTDLVRQSNFILEANAALIRNMESSCFCPDMGQSGHLIECSAARGFVLSPFFSFLNHSCVPNATYRRVNGKVVVLATRPIEKNEQVFVTYAREWDQPKKERQEHLYTNYNFNCDCQACKNDWPEVTPEEKSEAEMEFMRYFEEFEELDLEEIELKARKELRDKMSNPEFDIRNHKFDIGIKVDSSHGDPTLEEGIYPLEVNPELFQLSKTIHEIFERNSCRSAVIKTMYICIELKQAFARSVLGYDCSHFEIPSVCVKNCGKQ